MLNASQPYLSPNTRWQAQWIWADSVDPKTPNAVVLFRHTFSLPASQTGLRLYINACSNYRLWVNGELLADGPCPSASHHSYVDEHDLSVYADGHESLTLAVLVRTITFSDALLLGGLMAEVRDDSGTVLAASSNEWLAQESHAWRRDTYHFRMNKLAPFQEHLNANGLDDNWVSPDYEDGHWRCACPIPGRGRNAVISPWSHLLPRPIDHLERKIFFPDRIESIESCIYLLNRIEAHDAAIEATQPGTHEAVDLLVQDADTLIQEAGECVMSCSQQRPGDIAWDGVRDPAITLAFDEELTAYIEVELTAPKGAIINIASAERLIDGRLQNLLEGRFTERYVCREGRQVFRSLNWRAFRFLRMRLSQAQTPATIHAVRAIRVRTPLPREATFQAPEQTVAVDQLCRRTIRLCCVDGIFDTPWREASQWLGDVANVTIPALHWVYGDMALSGKFMMQAGLNCIPEGLLSNLSNQQPSVDTNTIPDYSLWWLYALREHYHYTGEEGWYRMFYPEALRIMRWHLHFMNDKGFLADLAQWVFIDWADVSHAGASAANNAIFAMACDVLAEMAVFNGDVRTQGEFNAIAQRIRDNFKAYFWDETQQCVVDAVVEGKQIAKVSEHGNAAALLFDCLEEQEARDLIARAYDNGKREGWVECQPYFTRVVLEALYRYDRRDLALDLIEERWGKRFRDRGWDTCLEEWTANGSWREGNWTACQRSTSHAWSAGASEFLVRRVSGIELLESGGKQVSVSPYEGDFAYTISVPLQYGDITVRYTPGDVPEVTATGDVHLSQENMATLSQ